MGVKKNVFHHGVVKVTDRGEIEVFQIWNLNPLRSNISMLFYVLILYIFHGTDKENIFTDQELLKLEIISFILITLIFHWVVIPQGEIGR